MISHRYYEMIKPLPIVLGVQHVLSAEKPQIIRKSGHKQEMIYHQYYEIIKPLSTLL